MKRNKKLIILMVVASVVMAGILLLPHKTNHQGHEVTSATMYHCPMHPTYTSDRPGDCPICDMKLVKMDQAQVDLDTLQALSSETQAVSSESTQCIYHECPMLKEGEMCPMLIFTEEGKAQECPVCKQRLSETKAEVIQAPKDIMGYTAVMLSDQKQQLIGIRTAPVIKKTAKKKVRTVGKIAYDPELYQAEQEYLEAIQAYNKAAQGAPPEITERAKALVDATQTKLELMGLSEELVQDIKKAGVPDRSLILAKQGGTVWMYAPIYEQDLDIVTPGQKVKVTAQNIMAGKIFSGEVRSIDPVFDPQTRSVRVRAVLDNSEGLLRPNVYVDVEIEVELGEQLLISENAVLDSGERKIAFVAREQGVFEPRRLILGPKLEDYFVVISGVTEGENVVAQATFFVDSESRLKAAIDQSTTGHQH